MGWDYFSRLSRAARWYLPPSEAAEVLEDYREIVKGRSGEELRRDLGTPGAAVKQLVQPKAYRRWLAVFVFSPVGRYVLYKQLRLEFLYRCTVSPCGGGGVAGLVSGQWGKKPGTAKRNGTLFLRQYGGNGLGVVYHLGCAGAAV